MSTGIRTASAVTLACALLTTGCTTLDSKVNTGGRIHSESDVSVVESYSWPTSPAHLQPSSSPATPEVHSYQGDGYGVEVNGVQLAVSNSFYGDTVTGNIGSERYPVWQDIEAPAGTRFLVIEGTMQNDSGAAIHPYARTDINIQAEASDGSVHGISAESHMLDRRAVPMHQALGPNQKTSVQYFFTIPLFLAVEHVTLTPLERYYPEQTLRIQIQP